MKYKGWPLWRERGTLGGRWELEIFNEEGSTVVERIPLNEVLSHLEVARVISRLAAVMNLPPQPSKFELLSEPDPAGEVVPFPAPPKTRGTRP
jgi:hypothetical protein